MRISTEPKVLSPSATISSITPGLVMSAGECTALTPNSRSMPERSFSMSAGVPMPLSTMLAPALASARAEARPMPLVDPVMTAALPANEVIARSCVLKNLAENVGRDRRAVNPGLRRRVSYLLTRFLNANRFPSSGQAREHASVENALAIRRGQDHGPEHLVFGVRRIDRGDAHFCDTGRQHVGTVRGRIAPAGKRFRHGVITGGNILDRLRGIEARRLDALTERGCDIVIELILRSHRA